MKYQEIMKGARWKTVQKIRAYRVFKDSCFENQQAYIPLQGVDLVGFHSIEFHKNLDLDSQMLNYKNSEYKQPQ